MSPGQCAVAVELLARADVLRAEVPGASLAEAVAVAAVRWGRFRGGPACLTAGELRVAELVGDGLTNREVGRVMGITEPAVRRRLAQVRESTGRGDRVGVVVAALESGQLPRRPWSDGPITVSPLEYRLLSLVAQGLPNLQVADVLGVSYYVVSNRLRRLFARFGARDRAHLVRRAVDAGVLSLPILVPGRGGAA